MTNGPPGTEPLKSRHCACCTDARERVSQLRELVKQRGDEVERAKTAFAASLLTIGEMRAEIDTLRTQLDAETAARVRYQAAFEACMGTRGGA